MTARAWYEPLLDRGWIPDPVVRLGIRRQLRARLRAQAARSRAAATRAGELRPRDLARGPIARHTGAANEQHYEVPPEFFAAVLGRHWKYSCAHWDESTGDLDDAELRMLDLCIERAGVRDGQRILDLGCGWGSLALRLAERFPGAEVTAVSNSGPQIDVVRRRAREAGVANVVALRADVNDLSLPGSFDRVLSVEMFEHMNNLALLLRRIAGWLRPDGRLFVHHFAHRRHLYRYDHGDSGQWMARHFFTGGMMPSADLLSRFDDDLRVIDGWEVNGRHYRRTCEAWLENMLRHRDRVLAALAAGRPGAEARRDWHRWRVFFMACAELFGHAGGDEWIVVHRLLEPSRRRARGTLDART